MSKRLVKIIGIVAGVVVIVVIAVLLSRDGNDTGISQVDLNTDDGTATVYFTEDVYDRGARFTITAKTLDVNLPEGLNLVGDHIYDITCSTTTFSESIVICLPVPEGINEELAYAIVSLDNQNWTCIGGSLDKAEDTIMARVDHLSDFAVVSAEESTGPSECRAYDTLDCQNAVASFEFENENASVFSLPCPLGDVDLESVIVSQACSTVLSYVIGGSVVPGIGTVVGAIGGLLAVGVETVNPVRIAPLTEDVTALSDGQIEGGGLLDPDTVSAIVFLDFAGTGRDLEYIQRLKELEVHVRDRIPAGPLLYGVRPLLSQTEMRSLDPCKSYIVFPKRPFDIPDKAKQSFNQEVFLEAKAYYEWSWIRYFQSTHAQTMRIDLEEVWTPTPDSTPGGTTTPSEMRVYWDRPIAGYVDDVAISHDGSYIAVAYSSENVAPPPDGYVCEFDTSGNLLWKVNLGGWIASVTYTPDGSNLYANGHGHVYLFDHDGNVVWDSSASQNVADGLNWMAINPDNHTIAAWSLSRLVVFDDEWNILSRYRDPPGWDVVACSTPDASRVVEIVNWAGDHDSITIHNQKGELLGQYDVGVHLWAEDIDMTLDGTRIAVTQWEAILLLDDGGNLLWKHKPPDGYQYVQAFDMSPDGTRVALVSQSGSNAMVEILNSTGDSLTVLDVERWEHTHVESVAISSDGSWIGAVGWEGPVRLIGPANK